MFQLHVVKYCAIKTLYFICLGGPSIRSRLYVASDVISFVGYYEKQRGTLLKLSHSLFGRSFLAVHFG